MKSSIVRWAVHHKDKNRIQAELAENRNPLIDVQMDVSTAEEVVAQHDWSSNKNSAGTGAKCALMSTYVNDGSMDVKKGLSNIQWDVIRMLFESDDPEFTQR
jgi:hypothetical protein